MPVLLVSVLLALAPLAISRATQKGVNSLTSLLMYGVSMFALPALYGPILLGWCSLVDNGCYGNGWTDMWISLWTSAAALAVLVIVSAIAIFQYSDTDT